MSGPSEIPVLVGVGQTLQRTEDPQEAAEPLELMVAALERAADDCGVPKLVRSADSVYVLRGAWGYGDPKPDHYFLALGDGKRATRLLNFRL